MSADGRSDGAVGGDLASDCAVVKGGDSANGIYGFTFHHDDGRTFPAAFWRRGLCAEQEILPPAFCCFPGYARYSDGGQRNEQQQIEFDPEKGIVFTAGGLFYYFEKEQVRSLLCAMAERFPGGMIAFDGVNALWLKGVSAEVKLAGNNSTKSFFSLERPKEELESWSPGIVNVVEKDYADGYLKGGYRKTPVTRLFNYIMRTFHMSFMLHAEFAESL